MIRTPLLTFGFVTFFFACFAQTPNCTQTLRLARSTYDQGRLHEVQQILDQCLLRDGFNLQEKEDAYKLLSLTYLYLEEPEKADEAMLNLLKTNPYFEIKPASDPAEFIALYNTFRTRPIYRIGLNVGVNATQPNVATTLHTIPDSKSNFKYKVGFQFAATVDVPVTDLLTLNGALGYQQKSFEMVSTRVVDNLTNTTTAIEKESWLSVPITLQYKLKESRYNPYASAGFSADYLLGASIPPSRLREAFTSVEPRSFDLKHQRNKFNVSAVVAAGSKVKVGGGYINVEIKYTYGITKVTNEKNAYYEQDIYSSYGLPNTTFRLNSLSFTAGYIQNIFNPKKLSTKK